MADTTTSDAIKKQLDDLNNQLNKQIQVQQTFGQTGADQIGQLYGNLGTQLQGNLGKVQDTVNQGSQEIGGAYDASQNNINNAGQTVQQLLGHEVNLGSGNFNSSLQEIQRLGAENGLARANSTASYDMLGTGNINAAQQAIADAATSGTNKQADLKSQIAAQISDLQDNYTTQRSAMEVQLAQVLADEKYKQDQMQLQRDQMAQDAREAALNRAASAAKSGSSGYGKGREELMRWAVENHISQKDVDEILKGINVASTTGQYADAYYTANKDVKSSQNPNATMDKLMYGNPKATQSKGVLAPGPNLNTVSTGLDIYYGRY